ncbi:MAG: GerAB/ArcD/ProY family transporter [Acutalibacteraceae bacterium]
MIKDKCTSSQFFSVLYLTMLNTVFMYVSSPQITISSTDTLLRSVVFVIVSFIVILPTYAFCKVYKKSGLNIENDKSPVLKAVSIFYAVVYFIDGLLTLSRFDFFANSELFSNSNIRIFTIIFVISCCLLALNGLGGLSRASVLFSFVVICATVFMGITLIDKVDLVNFSPLFENGITDFFRDSLFFSLRASEIGAILIFLPEIKGNIKKSYIVWTLLSAVTYVFIMFFVIGSLGSFADMVLFPTFASVTLARFSLFERLDAIETAIWILCAVTKLTFFINIILKTVGYTFPKIKKGIISTVVGILMSVYVLFLSGNIERFEILSNTALTVALYIVPIIVLPCVLLIYILSKRRNSNEKTV